MVTFYQFYVLKCSSLAVKYKGILKQVKTEICKAKETIILVFLYKNKVNDDNTMSCCTNKNSLENTLKTVFTLNYFKTTWVLYRPAYLSTFSLIRLQNFLLLPGYIRSRHTLFW